MIDGIHGNTIAGVATLATALFSFIMLFFSADQPAATPRPDWLGRYAAPGHMAIRFIVCLAWLVILCGAAGSGFAILFVDPATGGVLTADEQNDLGAFFRTVAGPFGICQAAGNTWRVILLRAGVPDKQDALA